MKIRKPFKKMAKEWLKKVIIQVRFCVTDFVWQRFETRGWSRSIDNICMSIQRKVRRGTTMERHLYRNFKLLFIYSIITKIHYENKIYILLNQYVLRVSFWRNFLYSPLFSLYGIE